MTTPLLTAVAAIILATVTSAATAAESPPMESGRQVFEANCAMCHGSDATGMMGMHPSLRGAVERLTREGVEVTIRNGRDTNPPMPAFEARLTDQEINHVIAYIDSLPPGPRNFGPDTDGGMMDGMMGSGMWMWLWLWPLLLATVLVLIVVAVVRAVRTDRTSASDGSSTRELLDRRYAAGELTREEYLERRRDLES
ncbi:MAG: c-type cytochrome [Nitriliruptorales bacterium]